MQDIKKLVDGMRGALTAIAKVVTAQYTKDAKADKATPMPVGCGVMVKVPLNEYKKGERGIVYATGCGSVRVVVGSRIGTPIPVENLCPVVPVVVGDAVGDLSDKRVTSVLRNLVQSAHDTFPSMTWDYENQKPIAPVQGEAEEKE